MTERKSWQQGWIRKECERCEVPTWNDSGICDPCTAEIAAPSMFETVAIGSYDAETDSLTMAHVDCAYCEAGEGVEHHPEPTVPTVDRIRLWGWDREINDSIRALLFGELVKRAAPIVQHYQSDLFHDAAWVAKWVNGPMTFWFVAREWGTHIGTDEGEAVHYLPAVLNANRGDETMRAWSVQLERVGGEWFAVITDKTTVSA